MRFFELLSKLSFEGLLVFLYFIGGILFFIYLFFKIQNKTDNLEEQVYLEYCAIIWCCFWPIMFLKDIVFRRRR